MKRKEKREGKHVEERSTRGEDALFVKGLSLKYSISRSIFEVSEQGAKGSAATFATVERSSDTRDRYFEVDHPFVFLVWDYYSGMLLLMGRVLAPEGGVLQ